MRTVNATLTRPYCRGTLEYRLLSQSDTDGESYDLEIICTGQGRVRVCRLEDITRSRERAFEVALLFFRESVDPCHAREIIEEMLPI